MNDLETMTEDELHEAIRQTINEAYNLPQTELCIDGLWKAVHRYQDELERRNKEKKQ